MWALAVVAGLAAVGVVGLVLLLADAPISRTPSGTDMTSGTPSSPTRATVSQSPAPATSPTGSSSPSGSLDPSPSPPPTEPSVALEAGPVPTGTWAGPGLTLVVRRSGASAEFDCAIGAVTQPLGVDISGAVRAEGWYAPDSGGPVGPSEPVPTTQQASWVGTLSGGRLKLSVHLSSGTSLGPFRLALGADPQLEKCL